MKTLLIVTTGAVVWLLTSCWGQNQPNTLESMWTPPKHPTVADTVSRHPTEQNIDEMTMQELRLLRSQLYADHGEFFRESDLLRYWRENTSWYDTLSRRCYALRSFGFMPPIALTHEELMLADRINGRMKQLRLINYKNTGGNTAANIMNIVNLFQFTEIDRQDVMDSLAVNNFALLPDTLPQLFQVYIRNDSLQIPNFITVDMMAQLSLVYEAMVLRTVEERYFMPMMADFCLALHNASMAQATKATNNDVREMATYNAAWFAVPYTLLTGKTLKIQEEYRAKVEVELAYINQQEKRQSALLDMDGDFDYGVFKPYGHYAQSSAMRRYFRAWKWLQLAPYCSNSKLQRIALVCLALQSARTNSGGLAMDTYMCLHGAMEWFIGYPAGCSLLDMSLWMKKERVTTPTAALDVRLQNRLRQVVSNAASVRSSTVKYPVACADAIYVIPQPLFGDEELHPRDTLADMAQANRVLMRLREEKEWQTSSYGRYLESVRSMQRSEPGYNPGFTWNQAWHRKTDETVTTLLKKMERDMSLYGVIPEYSDPLPAPVPVDTVFPEPVTVGYVEPALSYWNGLQSWVEQTAQTLEKYRLYTDTLLICTARMQRYAAMMANAAWIIQNREPLPDTTSRFIAHVGDSIQQFTLSMIEPAIDRWEWAAGTDRTVNENRSIRQIYVIVEINGYLYLTKGAVF